MLRPSSICGVCVELAKSGELKVGFLSSLSTELSTNKGQIVDNFVDKGVFLYQNAYIRKRNDMQIVEPVGKKKIYKFLLIAAAIAIAFLAIGSPLIASAATSDRERMTVVLDAGHGGEDAGVRGVRTGVKESELNLKVVLLLGEYFEAGGFKVIYTRKNDTMLRHPNVKDNKKRADLFRRGDIINAAKPVAVISIHMNKYSSAARRGAQVFFGAKSAEGRRFAEILQQRLNEDVNPSLGGRTYSALTAEKYLLECTPYPAVIAECGFLSNPLDEQCLLDPEFRAELAYAVYQGTLLYLNTSGTSFM